MNSFRTAWAYAVTSAGGLTWTVALLVWRPYDWGFGVISGLLVFVCAARLSRAHAEGVRRYRRKMRTVRRLRPVWIGEAEPGLALYTSPDGRRWAPALLAAEVGAVDHEGQIASRKGPA